MTWTEFWDMHSGGGLKEEPYHYIYIEAPERKATEIFKDRFGHDPEDTYCECCGQNYAIDEDETLEEATRYQRDDSCGRMPPQTIEQFERREDVLILYAADLFE
jgi:hypothetical protein